jgi:ribosome recycling factor
MQDHQYSKVYQIGGTTIYIVAPQITEEERMERLKEIKHQIWLIWLNMSQRDKSDLV